jgi:23S rRNA (cytosine1962-C5)-methyltransferase
MQSSIIRLKKGEDRRIRAGHPWIFSNEIDTKATPLKGLTPGQETSIIAHDSSFIGNAYLNPHSLIAGRLYSHNPNDKLDLDFFSKRLQAALHLRTRLFSVPYYRLIFSEADGIPGVVIDRFGTDFVVQINTAGMELKKDIIAAAICAVLPDTTSILLRNDSKIRLQEGLTNYTEALFGEPPQEIMLEENGVKFYAPIWKGQKTGWFYDHRLNRARMMTYVHGKSVLDVFSYLGGWGVDAAVAGATSVDCIESSAFAGEFIQRNATLNSVESKVNVITDDAFDAMKALIDQHKQYDVIILDPPAFVKKSKDLREGTLAYLRINEMALRLLASDGILITCSCSMHVSQDDLRVILQRAATRTKNDMQIIERGHQGPDHPVHPAIHETDYLKSIVARKL